MFNWKQLQYNYCSNHIHKNQISSSSIAWKKERWSIQSETLKQCATQYKVTDKYPGLDEELTKVYHKDITTEHKSLRSIYMQIKQYKIKKWHTHTHTLGFVQLDHFLAWHKVTPVLKSDSRWAQSPKVTQGEAGPQKWLKVRSVLKSDSRWGRSSNVTQGEAGLVLKSHTRWGWTSKATQGEVGPLKVTQGEAGPQKWLMMRPVP